MNKLNKPRSLLIYAAIAFVQFAIALALPAVSAAVVGHWQLNELSGTSASDSSGNSNSGTLINGPIWTAGQVGGGLSFDGVDDIVNCGSGAALDNLSAVTVSAWIKADSMGEGGYGRILQKGGGVSAGWRFLVYNNQVSFAVDYSTTDLTRYSPVNAVGTGAWHHVAATWAGSASASGVKIYVNGAEVSSYPVSTDGSGTRGSDSAVNLYIGNESGGTRTFDGVIDDARVYNTVLTATEIQALYEAGASAPVGYWELNETGGTTALDSSGNANSGTLGNGPVWTTGAIGGGLTFDGVDDMVNCQSGASLDNLSAVTVSAWIKADSMGEGGYGRIVQKGGGTSVGWRFLVANTNRLSFAVNYSTAEVYRYSAANSIGTGVWYHVAATWAGSATAANIKIYVNGAEVSSYDITNDGGGTRGDDSGVNLYIGNDSGGTRTFEGVLDDVRVYQTVLSATEIDAIFDEGAGLPAAPSGLSATAVSSSQINLAWTDNADNETGFEIERKTGAGGTYGQIDTTAANATNYNDPGLAASTTYYYKVRATNSEGDSGYSNEANATTDAPPDTTAPSVSVTAPEGEDFVKGTVVVTADASDNVGVVGVQFKLDGSNLGGEDTSAPYSLDWDTTMASNGSHTLTAVARDAANNSTVSTAVDVTVDNSAPSVSVTDPEDEAIVSGASVAVAASASDNAGVIGVQFKLDGDNLGAEDTTAPYALSWDSTSASNGAHALTAVARDAAGNSSTSTTVNLTVDNEGTTTRYEAESLSATSSSGDTVSNFNEAGASGGVNSLLTCNALGDFVSYTVNVPSTATYNIKVRIVKLNSRARCKLYLDGSGTATGAEMDLYNGSTSYSYEVVDLGNVSLASGNHTFKCQTTGQTSGSTNWKLSFDYIELATGGGGSPPAAPSGLSATAVSSSQINLAWTDSSTDETGFKIERKTGAGGTYAQIDTAAAGATTYNNATGLSASTTYYYRVRATNASGDSAYSNEANATTQAGGGGTLIYDWQPQASWIDNVPLANRNTDEVGAIAPWVDGATVGGNLVQQVLLTGNNDLCWNRAPTGHPSLEMRARTDVNGVIQFRVYLFGTASNAFLTNPRHLRVVMEVKPCKSNDPITYKAQGTGTTGGSYPNYSDTYSNPNHSGKWFAALFGGNQPSGACVTNWWNNGTYPRNRGYYNVSWSSSGKNLQTYSYLYGRATQCGAQAGSLDPVVKLTDSNMAGVWHRIESEVRLTNPSGANSSWSGTTTTQPTGGDGFHKVWITPDIDGEVGPVGTRTLASHLQNGVFFTTENNYHNTAHVPGFFIYHYHGGSQKPNIEGWVWLRRIKVYHYPEDDL